MLKARIEQSRTFWKIWIVGEISLLGKNGQSCIFPHPEWTPWGWVEGEGGKERERGKPCIFIHWFGAVFCSSHKMSFTTLLWTLCIYLSVLIHFQRPLVFNPPIGGVFLNKTPKYLIRIFTFINVHIGHYLPDGICETNSFSPGTCYLLCTL